MLLLSILFAFVALAHEKGGGRNGPCDEITKEAKCEKTKGRCEWKEKKCMEKEGFKGKDPQEKKQKAKEPKHWEGCVREWCERHSWYGGLRMCHWEPEYGCPCKYLHHEEDCKARKDDCEVYDGGCRAIVRCSELDGEECKEKASHCALCDTGCVDKCKLGPGQKNLPMVSLQLNEFCECKLAVFY